MKKLMKGQDGFTLVQGLIGSALLGGLALFFSDLFSKSVNQSKSVEHRYERLDLEQGVRSVLLNPEQCKCNFKNIIQNNPSQTIPVNSIAHFKSGSNCDLTYKRNVAESNSPISGSIMKISDINLENFSASGPNTYLADLKINYDAGVGHRIRPSFIKNVRFSMTGNPATLSSCGIVSNSEDQRPSGCGYGKVCFNGRSLTFKNAAGAFVAVTVTSFDETGMILHFQTPAGRTMLLSFKEVGDQIQTSVLHPNWRKQFCKVHSPQVSPCHLGDYGANDTNCSSSLYWYDDAGNMVGNTEADAVSC